VHDTWVWVSTMPEVIGLCAADRSTGDGPYSVGATADRPIRPGEGR
jgi:hypothetical protein